MHRAGGNFFCKPVQLHFHHRQHAPQIIMNFPGNTGPFFFSDVLQVRRQRLQFQHHLVAFCHVAENAAHRRGLAIFKVRRHVAFHCNNAPILRLESGRHYIPALTRQMLLQARAAVLVLVWVNDIEDVQRGYFFLGVTEHLAPGAIHKKDAPIRCDALDEVAGTVKQVAEPRLAFAQCLLRTLTFNGITDDTWQDATHHLFFHQIILCSGLERTQSKRFIDSVGQQHNRNVPGCIVQPVKRLETV